MEFSKVFPAFYWWQLFLKDQIYLIKPLILRWPLQNSFHDALQLINSGGLFGICEDGRLMASDHKKHILGGEEQKEQKEEVSWVLTSRTPAGHRPRT